MRLTKVLGILAACSALACAQIKTPEQVPTADAGNAGSDSAVDSAGPGTPDVAAPAADVARPEVGSSVTFIVYAHTSSQLYGVDPETMTIRLIGPFMRMNPLSQTLAPFNGVTDIAVDHSGRLTGLSSTEVLRIDERTAECTLLSMTGGFHNLNGLSWVNVAGSEVLMATAGDGSVFRLDPMTGQTTPVGSLGAGYISSGDLVSVTKYGTLVTIKRSDKLGDWLASLDPATGAATPIGEIGFNNVWGIGFWKDRVFGFAEGGQFLLINPDTGAGTLAQSFPNARWWGAGVSTSVFVIP